MINDTTRTVGRRLHFVKEVANAPWKVEFPFSSYMPAEGIWLEGSLGGFFAFTVI